MPIQRALKDAGYNEATPIQEKSIKPLLEGHDLLGCAQTGTGKTAAFALPILEGLSKAPAVKGKRPIRSLILAPTRELAIQIAESFETYGKYLNLKTTVIFGGVSQNPQTSILNRGVDILVATPGRLLDLINQKYIKLAEVEFFVLDEADMMLDMGMIHDVRKIIAFLPKKRQTLFFSATMPKEIATLADSILDHPVKVEITPVASTVDTIRQSVYHVNKKNKISLLMDLLKKEDIDRVLVFSRTKHGADKIVKELLRNKFEAQAIHGNKSQNARQLALKNFKEKITKILVATDIAARGIDVEELSHVIIYDLPEVPETYVHRIGRTGRAGLGGAALSFCDTEEKHLLRDIEKLIRKAIPVVEEHAYPLVDMPVEPKVDTRSYASSKPSRNQQRGGGGTSQRSTQTDSRASSRSGNGRNDSRRNSYSQKKKAV